MDSSMRQELERYYNERQNQFTLQEKAQHTFGGLETSPTQTQPDEPTYDKWNLKFDQSSILKETSPDKENNMRQALVDLQAKIQEYEVIIQKLRQENNYFRAQYDNIQREKQMHIDNHAQEKLNFDRKFKEAKELYYKQKQESESQVKQFSQQFEAVKHQLEKVKKHHSQKEHYYKQQISELQSTYKQELEQKDYQIKQLSIQLYQNQRASPIPSEKPIRRSKSRASTRTKQKYHSNNTTKQISSSQSSMRFSSRFGTPRQSQGQLDQLSTMIVNLEKVQAEGRQQLNSMMLNRRCSQTELNKMNLVLESNQKDLAEARKKQEEILQKLVKYS